MLFFLLNFFSSLPQLSNSQLTTHNSQLTTHSSPHSSQLAALVSTNGLIIFSRSATHLLFIVYCLLLIVLSPVFRRRCLPSNELLLRGGRDRSRPYKLSQLTTHNSFSSLFTRLSSKVPQFSPRYHATVIDLLTHGKTLISTDR